MRRPSSTSPSPLRARPSESIPAPRPEPLPGPRTAPAPAPRFASEIAIHERADADVRTATVAPKNVSGFKLPPSTLLNAGEGPQAIREDVLREEAKVLVEKCAEFDVRGQVVQINPGPMVTTYEFKPEAGVKYSRVTGLADDLCLAMRAESILIERMAGKSTVGIQVPNHERETIHLRDVIESETVPQGQVAAHAGHGQRHQRPHRHRRSGLHASRAHRRLHGLGQVRCHQRHDHEPALPHHARAGAAHSRRSQSASNWACTKAFRTYSRPSSPSPSWPPTRCATRCARWSAASSCWPRAACATSTSTTSSSKGIMPSLFDDGEDEQPLPFIVIIIDELADLMMLDRANVEESITRLAQMARAVGIHLILATQRPSVDVITGLIKANVPTRISFRLATKVDSRTILDTNGAEALLGRGDMLFLPPGTSRLMRLHAPYVSEKETAAVVDFWKAQGQAEYVEGFLESPKDERARRGRLQLRSRRKRSALRRCACGWSSSSAKPRRRCLQRRLRIGYGRAAHLIDLMERDGLVGPADGSRPRELLKAPGWLHEVAATANE